MASPRSRKKATGRRVDPVSKDTTKAVPPVQGAAPDPLADYPELQSGRRIDPMVKSAPAEMAWGEVVNGRPDMHYVRVPFNSATGIRQRYEAMGYMYVRNVEGGPRFRGGAFDSDTGFVMVQDCVLMCIPKEEHERIKLEGWDGQGGLKAVREREKRMDARNYHEGLQPGRDAFGPGGNPYFRFAAAEG
jgi:hypothetical protein